jgi:hypothetical protein
MRSVFLLAAASLLVCSLSSIGAPAPAAKAVNDKYLPDDSAFVLVVNVEQFIAAPLYTGHLRKRLDYFLGLDAVPRWAKELVAALPRDVERLTVAAEDPSAPMVLIEGRVDKLRDFVKQLAKEMPASVKEQKFGDVPAYEFVGLLGRPDTPCFVAVLDSRTAVVAPQKELVEALDKAAGKRKTQLKSADLRRLLGGLRVDTTIQFVATKDMVTGTAIRDIGERREVTHTRLGDNGTNTIVAGFTAGADMRGRVTLTARDEATAKRHAAEVAAGLEELKVHIKGMAANDKNFAALLKGLETVKIGGGAQATSMEGRCDPQAVEGFIMSLFVGAPSPPPRAVKP